VGLGQVFRWFRDGTLNDDSEVALLHGDAAHGHRPLTVPLVNVRWAAQRARLAKVLTSREAEALLAAASGIFYQERSWPAVLARLGPRWSGREHFQAFSAGGLPDIKAEDARAVLAAASQFAKTVRQQPLVPPRWRPPSPLVRWRLAGGGTEEAGAAERRVLAGLARSFGLRADTQALLRARAAFARERGWSLSKLDAMADRAGLNGAETLRFSDELALARLVTERGARLLPGVDPPRLAGRFEERLRRR
jgi:hypothetical protein